MKFFATRFLTLFFLMAISMIAEAQPQRIDRKALVRRHNPHITRHDNNVFSEKWLLGSGNLLFHVDATGLQTFASESSWPITVGLNFPDTTGIDELDARLDRWTGRFDSRFRRNGQKFRVETVCMQAAVAARITSDTIFEISLRSAAGFPVRTAQKSPNFKKIARRQRIVVKGTDGEQTHWLIANWYGDVAVRQDTNRVVLTCKGGPVEILFRRLKDEPSTAFFENLYADPFIDYALSVATEWSVFWNECGLADFSAADAPEARLAEQRMVEALYRFASSSLTDWWQATPLALYGFPGQVARGLHVASGEFKQLSQRPEVIATAEFILRSYTHPYAAERQLLSEEKVVENILIVSNAYRPIVGAAAEHLDSLSVPYLDADGLRQVAEKWQENVGDTANSRSAMGEVMKIPYLRLPPFAEVVSRPSSPDNDALLLLSIAARNWPEAWTVKVEDIVPVGKGSEND